MTEAARPWPPLIIADRIPPAVRWRDTLLTLLAWVGFAIFLDIEFKLSLASLRALETGRAHVVLELMPDLRRLAPFFLVGALLAVVLFVRSARTLIERSRELHAPQPAPLALADEAHGAGVGVAMLTEAREQRIVVVHSDAGRTRIETRLEPLIGPPGIDPDTDVASIADVG